MQLTKREFATVTAALRYFQANLGDIDELEMDAFKEARRLNYEGIDALCERLETEPDSFEVKPLVYDSKKLKYYAKAEYAGEGDIYNEMRIGIFKTRGNNCVADILVTANCEHKAPDYEPNMTGEPVLLITADGHGDGDHAIRVFPLRPREEMVKDE
jgi:hypothetical protein